MDMDRENLLRARSNDIVIGLNEWRYSLEVDVEARNRRVLRAIEELQSVAKVASDDVVRCVCLQAIAQRKELLDETLQSNS